MHSSDMTRTIPVSGKYNDRQKRFTTPFYALKTKQLKYPGTIWKQYHIEVGKLMTLNYWFRTIDKADVQNETQTGLLTIFLHARTSHTHGIRHARLRGILTEPMLICFHQSPEFIFR
jgi:Xaa-Pro aminopeptidase